MKYSPAPVAETAHDSLSAYVPAPMIGVSPMRPYILFVVPPVDVAAARLPLWSSATAPTVPKRFSSARSSSACGFPSCSFSNSSCNAFQRRSVQKYDGSTISNPIFVANSSAPRPAIITCFDFSITARAAVIGFLMIATPATEPAFFVFPSMIAASSSFFPSCVNTAPFPALKSGESSMKRTVASTASRLEPPLARTACPICSASLSAARYSRSRSSVMFLRLIVPAPPCITSMNLLASSAPAVRTNMNVAVTSASRLNILRTLALLLLGPALYGQSPSADSRTIETRHFRVHYPREYEEWSMRAASRLESIREAVSKEVGFAPAQVVDVLVMNPIAQPNGAAFPLLESPRMIFFAEPPGPDEQLGAYGHWIDLLAVHEYAHTAHMLRPSRNPLERLLLPFDPILFRAPRWVLEGYATVIEGRLTGAGRPTSTFRALLLRRWAESGQLPAYGELNSSQSFAGMSMAYLMGSAYLEWLRTRGGRAALRE